jgi:hypothetical protein
MWRKVALPAFSLILTLNSCPSTVNFDQEIPIELSLSCPGCGDSFLRTFFFPSGTNYFGLTKNDRGDWIGTSADKTLYFHISSMETKASTWSGTLLSKVDTSDTAYSGPGSYFFKVIRYTASGSKSGETEVVNIEIVGPQPATPLPTSVPTPRPTPMDNKALMNTIITPSVKVSNNVTLRPSIFTPTFTPLPASDAAAFEKTAVDPPLTENIISDEKKFPGILFLGIITTAFGFLTVTVSALLLLKKSGKISIL